MANIDVVRYVLYVTNSGLPHGHITLSEQHIYIYMSRQIIILISHQIWILIMIMLLIVIKLQ